jgi:Zn finger protein HypA/HybF involved in hydrogenase expression
MKHATLAEIKKELKSRDVNEIMQICLRLGRFKKDNKELLTYLLFDAQDEQAYIKSIQYEIDDMMEDINTSHVYYAKKGLQKMLRNLNKYIRYSGNKQTELEVRLHFCKAVKKSGIAINKSTTLVNMYDRQVQKVKKALTGLHEDIQGDYQQDIEHL